MEGRMKVIWCNHVKSYRSKSSLLRAYKRQSNNIINIRLLKPFIENGKVVYHFYNIKPVYRKER